LFKNTFLCSTNDGQLKLEDDPPSKPMLENNKCFLLDCGAEVFVWVGRVTQVDDRKAASKAAEVKGRAEELKLRF
jgi:Gelsolin repeat